MSQPPSQQPWSWDPAPLPGAEPQLGIGQPPQYVHADRSGRPGLITLIGVISIIVACFTGIFSLITSFQAVGYYMMTLMSSSMAATQSRIRATATAAPPVVVEAGVVGPRGMAQQEREQAVAALSRMRPLTPSRKRHLDAILAASGRDMATGAVTESGTMPAMRSGEAPPDYFVTPAGRLEVFNDRAVFYPISGATVRASAPPLPPPGPNPTPPPAPAPAEPDQGEGPGADIETPAAPATVPATMPAMPGALTSAEVQSVIQQAQSFGSNALNAAQVNGLQALLAAPGQQLVTPGAAEGSVVSVVAQSMGPTLIQFSDGGSLTLGQQGNVISITTAPLFPTFSFNPLAVGVMLVTSLASMALAVYLLVVGIVTLRDSPRGRRLHLVYACIAIPLAIAFGIASAQAARDWAAGVSAFGAAAGSTGIGLFSGVIPVVLGCAYPVALLIALNLRSVREYYWFSVPGTGGLTSV